MTLIASTLKHNIPVVMADILMSSRTGRITKLPTNNFSQPIQTRFIYKPDGLSQKLYIIGKNICIAFSGIEAEITPFLRELRQRNKFYDNELSLQQIDTLINDSELENSLSNSSFIMIVAEIDDKGNPDFKYRYHGTIFHKETINYGSVSASGSGTEQFLKYLDTTWRITTDVGPYQHVIHMNLNNIAYLFSQERLTRENLKDAWGAGFEIATHTGQEFQKIDNVAFMLWQTTYDNDGNIKRLIPDLLLHYRYINDYLFITSIDINKSGQFDEEDWIVIRSKNFSRTVFVVPEFFEVKKLTPKELEQDYSFNTTFVAQGISTVLPNNSLILQALFTNDSSVRVRHRDKMEIEITFSLKWLNAIKIEAQKTFKNNIR